MKQLHYLLFLPLLLCTCFKANAQKQDTLILGNSKSYQLLPYIDYLEDAKRNISITEAVNLFNEGKYKKSNDLTTFNAGITFSAFWFRFTIKNNTKEVQNLILGIGEKVDTLWLFKQQANKVILISATGFGYSYSSRLIGNRNFLFPLNISSNTCETYYLLAKNNADYMYIPFALKETANYFEHETSRYQLLSVYIGYFLFVVVFNIFLYFSLKDKLHIWYALHVFASLVYLMMEDGITYELVLKYTPSLRWLINEEYWWYGLMIIWLYVMQLILKQTRANSRVYQITKIVMIVLGVRIFVAFIPEITHFTFNKTITHLIFYIGDIAFLLGSVLLLIGIIEKIVQKSNIAFYYLIAIIFGLTGTLNIYFNYIGLTNFNIIKPNAMIVGLTIEVTILTFALTVRYNLFKKEREKLLAEASEYQTTLLEKILLTQENERKRLGEDLHDEVGSTISGVHLFTTNYFLTHKTANKEEKLYRKHLIKQLNKLVLQIRDIAHELMPKDFENRGIVAVLSEKINHLNLIGTIVFELIHTGVFSNLSKQIQLTSYRIISELLTNIIKHAKASKSTIQLNCNEDYFQIIVEDDGIGLAYEINDKGIGLRNIYNRVKYLNGYINFDKSKLGTTVVIEIPISKNE